MGDDRHGWIGGLTTESNSRIRESGDQEEDEEDNDNNYEKVQINAIGDEISTNVIDQVQTSVQDNTAVKHADCDECDIRK